MQGLEVCGAVRPIYGSLGVKRLTPLQVYRPICCADIHFSYIEIMPFLPLIAALSSYTPNNPVRKVQTLDPLSHHFLEPSVTFLLQIVLTGSVTHAASYKMDTEVLSLE